MEILSSLDGNLCFTALELILTLLASQSLLALKEATLSQREKQLIKRELSTELMVFHDFVKRRVLSSDQRDPLQRKKRGLLPMPLMQGGGSSVPKVVNVGRDTTRMIEQTPGPSTTSRKAPFNMTYHLSPIVATPKRGAKDYGNLPSSTPFLSGAVQPKSCLKAGSKRCSDSELDDVEPHDEPVFFPAEEPTYTELSFVKLVEEDYLHFLSNLFSNICQIE